MANPSKNKGTAWESKIKDFLNGMGFRTERRALTGAQDRGDIAGIMGVVIEAKDCQRVELAGWLAEAHKEAMAESLALRVPTLGVVWFKRRGKSQAADGYVVMDGIDFATLLTKAGYQ